MPLWSSFVTGMYSGVASVLMSRVYVKEEGREGAWKGERKRISYTYIEWGILFSQFQIVTGTSNSEWRARSLIDLSSKSIEIPSDQGVVFRYPAKA